MLDVFPKEAGLRASCRGRLVWRGGAAPSGRNNSAGHCETVSLFPCIGGEKCCLLVPGGVEQLAEQPPR